MCAYVYVGVGLEMHGGRCKCVGAHITRYTGRLWCHCRMVYLPMSYLYGQRLPPTPHPIPKYIPYILRHRPPPLSLLILPRIPSLHAHPHPYTPNPSSLRHAHVESEPKPSPMPCPKVMPKTDLTTKVNMHTHTLIHIIMHVKIITNANKSYLS